MPLSAFRRFSGVLPGDGYSVITPRTDDLHPKIKDDIFRWQAGSDDFAAITPDTLLRGDITTHESVAKKVIDGLEEIGIVDPTTRHAHTDKIDRHMVNKIAVISNRKHRELVMLLFFVEEETTRRQDLGAREEALKRKLAAEGMSSSHIQEDLKAIEQEKMALPSEREGADEDQ